MADVNVLEQEMFKSSLIFFCCSLTRDTSVAAPSEGSPIDLVFSSVINLLRLYTL